MSHAYNGPTLKRAGYAFPLPSDPVEALRALARDHAGSLDEQGADVGIYTLDAPAGCLWTCDGIHGLAIDIGETPADAERALAEVLSRISDGLCRCDDSRCDTCNGF